MNSWRMLLTYLVALLIFAMSVPVLSAETPVKLKSQNVNVKVIRWMLGEGPSPTEVPIPLIQLPAGKIILKDKDGKEHEHPIKAIWMGKYEVRWEDYLIFAYRMDVTSPWQQTKADAQSRPSMPYMPPDHGWGVLGYPAGGIHFLSAQLYCDWLSKTTGKKFRLPTEAEWEYACRAGGEPLKPDAKALDNAAWFENNAKETTHPVGKKEPNAWGFYDMLGNVSEYVVRDPNDKLGLVAGGSFQDKARDVHPGAREAYSPAWQRRDPQDPKGRSWLSDGAHAGFRLVMED